MTLKYYRPSTPSMRFYSVIDKQYLFKGSSIKALTYGLRQKGGRNNLGRITVHHQGGGNKKLYRKIDFKRDLLNVQGVITRIEYDPNRTSFIALVVYKNGTVSYITAANKLKVGDLIISSPNAENKIGNNLTLKNITVGSIIHNLEQFPGSGSVFSRSAGSQAQLISKLDNGYGLVKLNSGERRVLSLLCRATIGQVSNIYNKHINYGKAGKSRWLGILPTVRGVVKNPVDHPHGGRTRGGRPSCTPWGIPTKGYKTRRNKRTNKYIVQRIN